MSPARFALAFAALAGCRSCIALDLPLPYTCRFETEAADCAAGWRCGRDGRCHDPAAEYPCATDDECEPGFRCGLDLLCHARDVGAPLLCKSDSDCPGGWRCTWGVNRCHDPSVASDYPCRASADCEQGFRCSIEKKCRAPVAAAYPCGSNAHCEPGWACGPKNVCVDLASEALSAAYEGALTRESISPLLGAERAQLVAGTKRGAYTLLHGTTLTHVVPTADDVALFRLELDGGAVQSLVTLPGLTLLLDEAGFAEVAWADGGGELKRLGPAAGARSLKVSDENAQVLAWGDGVAWVYEADTGVRYAPLPLVGLDGGALVIIDATLNRASPLVATEEGLFFAWHLVDADGGMSFAPFVPSPLSSVPNAHCGTGGLVPRITQVDSNFTNGQLTVALDPPDGGAPSLVSSPNTYDCTGTDSTPACDACPDGLQLASFFASSGWATTLCKRPAVTGFDFGFVLAGTCETHRGSVLAAGRSFRTEQGGLTHAGAHGELAFFKAEGGRPELTPLSPSSVSRIDGRLWTAGYGHRPGIGFVATSEAPDASSPVEADLGEQRALAATRDAGVWSIEPGAMPRSDVLVAGPAGDGGTLEYRLTLVPYEPVRSVAARAPAPEAPFIEGWAVAGGTLFHFEASEPDVWTAEELPLPGPFVSVWADGRGGRAAARDGRVFGLPSQVPLSAPLPGGAAAHAYRSLCHQPYALTSAGVFRLRLATDGGLAQWEAEDLSTLIPGYAADPGFALEPYGEPSRFDLVGSDLFVTNRYGAVVKLSAPLSCP